MKPIVAILCIVCFLYAQGQDKQASLSDSGNQEKVDLLPYKTKMPFTAGFRYSRYGTRHLQVDYSSYWIQVGQEMALISSGTLFKGN